jgi:hypothetical protein
MCKVTSPSTETLPVGYFFNHLSCSNGELAKQLAVERRVCAPLNRY